MLFPVCIHKEKDSAFGVTIPDIPGCFTAGDTLEEAVANIQEAVELYFEGEDLDIPEPSSVEKLAADPIFEGGYWFIVDIDFSFHAPKVKRVNITLKQSDLTMIDQFAKQNKLTRSAFLAMAARKVVRDHCL